MEERIIELEIRSSFQEEKLRQLSDVLYAQQQAIDRLEEKLKVSEQRMARFAAAEGDGDGDSPASDEKPPHY